MMDIDLIHTNLQFIFDVWVQLKQILKFSWAKPKLISNK